MGQTVLLANSSNWQALTQSTVTLMSSNLLKTTQKSNTVYKIGPSKKCVFLGTDLWLCPGGLGGGETLLLFINQKHSCNVHGIFRAHTLNLMDIVTAKHIVCLTL